VNVISIRPNWRSFPLKPRRAEKATPTFGQDKPFDECFIGVAGDPTHWGHWNLAKAIRDQYGLKIRYVPSASHPVKGVSKTAPFHHRLKMAELAMANLTDVSVSDLESKLPPPNYTINTLEHLCPGFRTLFKDKGIRYPIGLGLDVIETMPKYWADRGLIILENCDLYVSPRDKSEKDLPTELDYNGTKVKLSIKPVKTPPMKVSSTMVRDWVAQGKRLLKLVPRKVEEYIYDNGLYKPASTVAAAGDTSVSPPSTTTGQDKPA
jgi:nicotinate-nucleotide adenylyltransferase